MKHAWLYSGLIQALKGEPLSSGLSTDESLISASAAPHCGTGPDRSDISEDGPPSKGSCQLIGLLFSGPGTSDNITESGPPSTSFCL